MTTRPADYRLWHHGHDADAAGIFVTSEPPVSPNTVHIKDVYCGTLSDLHGKEKGGPLGPPLNGQQWPRKR